MNRPCCSACKSPLDPGAGAGGRCPICGSPVIYKVQPSGPEGWDAVARRDAGFSARWALGEPIGAGRASLVYRGTAREGGEACAVKLLVGVTDPAVVHMFHSGDGCGPAVEHPGVVSPLACGVLANAEGEEIGYLVRPFVDGHALLHDLTGGALPLARSLSICAGVLAALQATHRAGLVHGDPKPTDVILTEDGQVRLVDAGCPREPLPVGAPGRPLPAGAPEYLAPEVAAGAAPSAASDLYAAGVMLLEMLTGANPFRLATPQASLGSHAGPPPVPAELIEAAPEVGALLVALLAGDPAARPEVADALRTAQELARASAARGTLLKLPLRRPAQAQAGPETGARVWAASGVLAVALAGAIVWGTRPRVDGPAPAPAPPAVRLMAGTRAVLVRLADPGAEPIRVRCWPDGTPEAAAPLRPSVSATGVGPLTMRIGDLTPDTGYRVRVLHGPGAGDEPELRVHTRATPADLVKAQRIAYAPGGVRVELALADPELSVEVSATGAPSVVTTGGPAERGVTLAVPALGSSELRLRFPVLGDEMSLGTVAGARERARAVSAQLAKLGDGALGADAPPAPAQREAWLVERLGIGARELGELARAVLPDEAVPLTERWILYQAVAQVAEVDPARTAWPELAQALGTLAEIEVRRADAPAPAGMRPLADPALAAEPRATLAHAALPLWTVAPADGRPAAELFNQLAEAESAPPTVAIPVSAAPPGDGDRLEVAVRAAGLDARTRLIVDAGDGAVVSLRAPDAPATPALATDTLPERAALEPASVWLVARFPAPARPAQLRLAAVRDPGAARADPVWVVDLVLRRVK